MQNIIIIGCLIVSVTTLWKSRFLLHPIVVFDSLWALILWLESFHLFQLFKARQEIYQLIYLGIISFNIGYFLYSLFRRKYSFSIGHSNGNFVPRYQLLYLLSYICIIFYIKDAFTSLHLLLSGNSMGEIRQLIQASSSLYSGSGSKVINALLVLIVTPSSMMIQVVGAIDFWRQGASKKLFYLAVILMVLSSISEGGRTAIVNFLVYMLIGYHFSLHRKQEYTKLKSALKDKRKGRISIILALSVLIGFLSWFTISRTGETLAKNMYLYFSMEPYMFDLWARRVDELNLWGYTESAFNGISFAVLYIFKNLFGAPFPTHWQAVYDLIRNTDSQWQIITGLSTTANAYVSGFWFFYLDGRLGGVIGGMLWYGAFLAGRFHSAVNFTSLRYVALLGFSIQGLLYFFIRFPFSNIYYALAFMMLLTIAFQKKKNEYKL